jgi:hypothetical protein
VSTSYFIYYRTAADAAEVRRVAGALQARLARESGVNGRLMRCADDPATWMEVYEGIDDPAAFERAEAAAVEQVGFARLLAADARRHIERFVAG